MPAVSRNRQPIPKFSFSVTEAVFATGAGRHAVMGAIARGELPARQIGPNGSGKKFLIPASALARWVGHELEPDTADAAVDLEARDTAPDDPAALGAAEPVTSDVPPGLGK